MEINSNWFSRPYIISMFSPACFFLLPVLSKVSALSIPPGGFKKDSCFVGPGELM